MYMNKKLSNLISLSQRWFCNWRASVPTAECGLPDEEKAAQDSHQGSEEEVLTGLLRGSGTRPLGPPEQNGDE